jgi:hypothetical protein
MSSSDHSLIYCIIKAGIPKALTHVIEYRLYKFYDKNTFLQGLRNVDWAPVYDADEVDDAVL